jgi:hypothetical protein
VRICPHFATTLTVEALNQITSTIIAAAINIHRTLGPGLLENAYTTKEGIKRVVNGFPE